MNDETEMIELFLENLDDTCFPIQLDWNNKNLYVQGIADALKASRLKLTEYQD